MKTILAGFGMAVLLFFIYLWIMQLIGRYEEKRYWKWRNRFYKELGGRIGQDAYWFVKNPRVFNTLQKIGQKLYENQSYDISRIRDEVDKLGEIKIK